MQGTLRFSGSGCPQLTWLQVNGLFAALHMVATLYVACKINMDYSQVAKVVSAVVEPEYVVTTAMDTESQADPMMAHTKKIIMPTSLPKEQDCVVQQMDPNSPLPKLDASHVPVEATLQTSLPVVVPAEDNRPWYLRWVRVPSPHTSTTPTNSIQRLQIVALYDVGFYLYRVIGLSWLLWICNVLFIISGSDVTLSDCQQLTSLSALASLCGWPFLCANEVVFWIYTDTIYGSLVPSRSRSGPPQ